MQRRWRRMRADIGERQSLYQTALDNTKNDLQLLLNKKLKDATLWIGIRAVFSCHIENTIDRELAETFFNSVTRRIFETVGVNKKIEFVTDCQSRTANFPNTSMIRNYHLATNLETFIRRILSNYGEIKFNCNKLERDLPRIATRIKNGIEAADIDFSSMHVEMLCHAFYRGQGAFLIGRIISGHRIIPLVFALLHPQGGVVVDAVVQDTDGVRIIFSYTRSAFNVEVDEPRELVAFLSSLMPGKPEAEIYSSVGFFKHGKTVLYRNVIKHTATCTDVQFQISPGKRGMVMIVFDISGNDMVVKLIRDRFDNPKKTTRNKIMQQYDFVFNHYRVGRLIEAHSFEKLSFDRCWFSDKLLTTLTTEAEQTVYLAGDIVIIGHAYLERRVTPLDIYLKEETAEKTQSAVIDFGRAIKDLAFANIFPGDMLLKNFGVTRHGRVVFYDYDEIVPLTDCRFRSIPQARTYMEELSDEPWYAVEENDVFPEEFSRFLGLSPIHKDLFLKEHADLLERTFWIHVQEEIRSGHIRHIRPYHPKYRLTKTV